MTARPADKRLLEDPAPALVRLDPAQARAAAKMLARAFFPDPLMVHYLPDPAWRAKALPVYMLACLRYTLLYGEAWVSPGLDGAALWFTPGRTGMPLRRQLRSGYWAVPYRLGWHAFRQMGAIEPVIDRIHREVAPGPHWYLAILGVEPSRQGQGIGSRLVASQLAGLSARGAACYLETLTEIDVVFYRRHGFEVAREVDLAPGVHMWSMLRQPG